MKISVRMETAMMANVFVTKGMVVSGAMKRPMVTIVPIQKDVFMWKKMPIIQQNRNVKINVKEVLAIPV